MIDAMHHAAHRRARTRNAAGGAASCWSEAGRRSASPVPRRARSRAGGAAASRRRSPASTTGGAAWPTAVSDFEALENLRRLAFTDQVDEPKQLELLDERARPREPALRDRAWQPKYSAGGRRPRHAVLRAGAGRAPCATTAPTGYFSAGALALAARGIEGLVRNGGRMRLIVGCTLDAAGDRGHREGEALRDSGRAQPRWRCRSRPETRPTRCARTAGLDGRAGHPRREGGGAVRPPAPADRRRRHVPREGRHHRGQDRRPARVQRQHQRDGTGWKRQLGELPRLHRWDGGTEAQSRTRRTTSPGCGPTSASARSSSMCRRPCARTCCASCRERTPRRGSERHGSRCRAAGRRSRGAPPASPSRRRSICGALVWGFIQHAPTLPNGGERVGEATAAVDALAASGPRVPAAVRPLAAEAADRRRGRARQDDRGGAAAAAGVARRPGEAHSGARAQGRAAPVADRAAREVQSQLADLRRPEADAGTRRRRSRA